MDSLLAYLKDKIFFTNPIQRSDLESPPPEVPRNITPSYTFSKFPLLPKEIRQQIWYHALPGPRVLLVKRSTLTHSNGQYTSNTTAPASYGGHQLPILHVNQESRHEALRYLTPLWDTYWNLSLDTPYFELQETCWEIKSGEFYAISEMSEMRRWGELDRFKNLAIDWRLWEWEREIQMPDYQSRFGRRFDRYEHPITLLNSLPNIKCCTFVFTKHPWNDNKLVIKPYVPWHLGPLTWQTTLEKGCERVCGNIQRRIDNRMVELKRENDLEIRVMAIHDRERQFSPEVYEAKGFQGIIRLA